MSFFVISGDTITDTTCVYQSFSLLLQNKHDNFYVVQQESRISVFVRNI